MRSKLIIFYHNPNRHIQYICCIIFNTFNMRQVIKPSDIQTYFGKKTRMSFKMMHMLRTHFGKTNQQPITVDEFCEYYGVSKESVHQVMIYTDQQASEKKQLEKVLHKNLNKANALEEVKEQKTSAKPVHVPYVFSKKTC